MASIQKMFFGKNYFFLPLKKPPSKVAQKYSKCFLPYCPALPKQKEDFKLQNVAYRPAVYKTGVLKNVHCKKISPNADFLENLFEFYITFINI